MTDERATYLYCLVHAKGAPRLTRFPKGLPGTGRPRAIDAGEGWWLIASDASLEDWNEAAIDAGLKDLDWVSRHALAHQAVVDAATRLGPVVPMKLFTLFRSEARALTDIRRKRKRLERIRSRIEGRSEWGVRMRFDPTALASGGSARAAGSGADFLRRKREVRDEAAVRIDRAREAAEAAAEALADAAEETRFRSPESLAGNLLLEADFLVSDSGLEAFRKTARALARRARADGLELVLTGPWPAYHFVADAA